MPKPYPVEKIVQVPVEKIVHVPKFVEKLVHIPKPYPVEKVVEKVVHVPKPYPVKEFIERKVNWPLSHLSEQSNSLNLSRFAQQVPYPVEKVVEKIVHVPVIKHIPVEIKGNPFLLSQIYSPGYKHMN